jgi:hypothetical protein
VTKDQRFCMVPCDVTDNASSYEALKKATNEIGQFLANSWLCVYYCRCIWRCAPGYMRDTDVKAYESQIRLNYLGTLYTVKVLIRFIWFYCSVFFTCCVCGFLGDECIYAYKVCYKGYLHLHSILFLGLPECLRQEMILYGIDVQCVFPGSILSPRSTNKLKNKPALTCEI